MNYKKQLPALVLACCSTASVADEMDHSQHDAHTMEAHGAHIGAAAHIHHQHPKGAWMLEYRFVRMYMDGLLDGTNGVGTRAISGALPGMPPTPDPSKPYRMAPTEMTMDMHVLMAMYGWSERVTLMGMGMYVENEMKMIMHMPAMDMTGKMDTDGFGDTMVGAMINVSDRTTASLSLSMPTGDIDQWVDMTMTGPGGSITNRVKAGYPMQLGSGTWDLTPSITYALAGERVGVGFQGSYTWRIGENDNNYALGDVIKVIAWSKHAVNQYLLGAFKVTYTHGGSIDGQDPELDPTLAPTTDPAATGGTRLDLSLGLNAFFGDGHSIGIEFGVPAYQNLNGPQMETDWMLSFSYNHM